MGYLSPDKMRSRSATCREQLETLLAAKAVVGGPNASQWRFLKDAIEHLLTGNGPSEFAGISAVQVAQLKFQVKDKLWRSYLRPGHSPNWCSGNSRKQIRLLRSGPLVVTICREFRTQGGPP